MAADSRQNPLAGSFQFDHRTNSKHPSTETKGFSSSPPAFGDGKTNLKQVNSSKSRGMTLVINEGGFVANQEPEVLGKGKLVCMQEKNKKNQYGSEFLINENFEDSPSNMMPIQKIIPTVGSCVKEQFDNEVQITKEVLNPIKEIMGNQEDGSKDEETTHESEKHVDLLKAVGEDLKSMHYDKPTDGNNETDTHISIKEPMENPTFIDLVRLSLSGKNVEDNNHDVLNSNESHVNGDINLLSNNVPYFIVSLILKIPLQLDKEDLIMFTNANDGKFALKEVWNSIRRKQKEFSSLPASRGSKRSWVLYLTWVGVKKVCKGFSALLECNACADWLAKFGCSSCNDKFFEMENFPEQLLGLVRRDNLGIPYAREY
ncbi:hypothetical protein MA16_Dca025540 [Dendrobium catenatum]|uniref:Uncharacterized protein n=1 Tax=Dendrobium catenatum TaxID=906689 RepID=A0A2I0XJ11_9ASPA|nr:hypothetical protein MA16_Dca025540 [Dendrobium catenatum]